MNKLLQWFKDYLIPHAQNAYKPGFFSKESVVAILSVILLVELAYLGQIFIVLKKTDFLAAVLPSVLATLANEDRNLNNTLPLSVNSLLAEAAKKKAEDMAARGYFSHTGPNGELPWKWLDSVGYKYSYAGENLAINFSDSVDVQKAWLNSPSHKANIVKKEFKEIGIGIAKGQYQDKDAIFVVEFFGTPVMSNIGVIKNKEPNSKTSVSGKEPAPKVLGEETAVAIKTNTPTQFIKSSVEKISTSPVSSTRNLMYLLVGIFSVALLLAVFIKIKVQHAGVVIGGLALISISLFLISFNKSFSEIVEVPSDASEASVFKAIP